MKTTRILVTGGTGFIGSAVVQKIEASGYDIRLTSRDKKEVDHTRVLYLNLTEPESILALEKKYVFDVIIHFGAQIGWQDKRIDSLITANVLSTGLLANWALRMGAFFIFSSAAIISGAKTPYISDDSIINTDTPYAKSKWLAEEIIKLSGVKHCIIRLSGVYGLKGPDHLGLNQAISKIIIGEPPQLYGSGNGLRNYIYVHDVANIIEYIVSKKIEGTHLLSGQESLSINKILYLLCDVFRYHKGPQHISGTESKDQVIKSSDRLPLSQSYKLAFKDILKRIDTK